MLFTGEMVAFVMNITSYSCMILIIKTRNSATPLPSPASGFGCRGIDAPELAHHPLVDAFAADVADRKYSSDYPAGGINGQARPASGVVSSPRLGSGVQNTANLVRGHRDG